MKLKQSHGETMIWSNMFLARKAVMQIDHEQVVTATRAWLAAGNRITMLPPQIHPQSNTVLDKLVNTPVDLAADPPKHVCYYKYIKMTCAVPGCDRSLQGILNLCDQHYLEKLQTYKARHREKIDGHKLRYQAEMLKKESLGSLRGGTGGKKSEDQNE